MDVDCDVNRSIPVVPHLTFEPGGQRRKRALDFALLMSERDRAGDDEGMIKVDHSIFVIRTT